jgi:large subunit ribosomal protein L6
MSRVGKRPVAIPAGVKVDLTSDMIKVNGPKGSLERKISDQVLISM